jgi:hypothetical protein
VRWDTEDREAVGDNCAYNLMRGSSPLNGSDTG